MTDVLVIGGGAAGMMAALAAADQGAQVCLLERNPKVGRKLYITGKGRCNVTNHCGVEQVLAFAFLAADVITYAVVIILMSRLDVEKHIEEDQKKIKQNQKKAANN